MHGNRQYFANPRKDGQAELVQRRLEPANGHPYPSTNRANVDFN